MLYVCSCFWNDTGKEKIHWSGKENLFGDFLVNLSKGSSTKPNGAQIFLWSYNSRLHRFWCLKQFCPFVLPVEVFLHRQLFHPIRLECRTRCFIADQRRIAALNGIKKSGESNMFKKSLIFVSMTVIVFLLICGCAAKQEASLPQLIIGCNNYEPYYYADADGGVGRNGCGFGKGSLRAHGLCAGFSANQLE